MNANSAQKDRAIFKSLKEKYSGKRISPSQLRVAVATDSTKSSILFPIEKNVAAAQGSVHAADIRLDRNDLFVVTKLGIYVMQETKAKPGSGLLKTEPTSFTDEATYLAKADLETLFNGFFKIKVGDTVEAESIPTRDMRVMRSTATENWSGDGKIDLPTTITLVGNGKNEITLNYNSYAGILLQNNPATATAVYAVLVAEGFLITGGAN